jgi:hypothetical protein
MSDDDTDDWVDYESGPFCRHWGELGACDDKCKCGHECRLHPSYDESCDAPWCACEKFEDAEDALA